MAKRHLNTVVAFQKDGIKLGGGKGMMSASEFLQWAPFFDELCNAASQKLKVRVYYDEATRNILTIIVLYNEHCT